MKSISFFKTYGRIHLLEGRNWDTLVTNHKKNIYNAATSEKRRWGTYWRGKWGRNGMTHVCVFIVELRPLLTVQCEVI